MRWTKNEQTRLQTHRNNLILILIHEHNHTHSQQFINKSKGLGIDEKGG